MSFVSYSFVAFMCACLLLYYVTPKKHRWIILLGASYAFYLIACKKYIIYIVLTTISTFFFGKLISDASDRQKEYLKKHKEDLGKEEKKQYKASVKTRQKRMLILCLVLNFGILAFLKYANFAIANVNFFRSTVFGTTQYLGFMKLVLPLGISFYTFQSMGYLIDLYYGKYTAQKNPFKFALFVSFFPQIIQGPISRYNQLSETLYEGSDFDYQNFVYGFWQIMWGLFKKLIIADRVVSYVQNVVGASEPMGGIYILLAVFFYSMQIYTDFSGGIDITIGVARMFGISVTANFDRPFFSKSIAEYWRRWHITLGTWFKDYIFYPLSIAKWTIRLGKWIRIHINETLGKKVPIYIATVIVWFITGLWHGAEWRYIIWGMCNCVLIILSTEFEPVFKKMIQILHVKEDGFVFRLFRVVRTFWIMSFLRIFDIAPGVRAALLMMRNAFRNLGDFSFERLYTMGMTQEEFVVAILGCFVLLCVSLMQRKGSIREHIMKKHVSIQWAFTAALIISVVIFGSYGMGYDAHDFIYLQF